MDQIKHALKTLRRPSVFISLVSQLISLLILLGFKVNESLVMTVAVTLCSILVTLGIMSNPHATGKGYGDDLRYCPHSGCQEHHVLINSQMVCTHCGTMYSSISDSAPEPDETKQWDKKNK